jgi:MFS family permease
MVDRFAVPRVAVFAHLFSLAGAILLSVWPGPWVAIPALTMIGMGYGFISGTTAGAIAQYWHKNSFGRVASQLYIAWCIAAVSLPVLAGWLYDHAGVARGADRRCQQRAVIAPGPARWPRRSASRRKDART